MARYTDTQSIAFDVYPLERSLIVEANGGSLVISAFDGENYVVSDTITEDSTSVLFTSGLRLQFAPADGAIYSIDESNRAS